MRWKTLDCTVTWLDHHTATVAGGVRCMCQGHRSCRMNEAPASFDGEEQAYISRCAGIGYIDGL
jgi:hypothetical protein